jgi:hypothetical protein
VERLDAAKHHVKRFKALIVPFPVVTEHTRVLGQCEEVPCCAEYGFARAFPRPLH